MFKRLSEKSKKIIYIILFSLLVLMFIFLLFFTKDSEIIDEVNDFIKVDTKLLYISSQTRESNYHYEILKKYNIEYLDVNSSKLTIFDKKKLQKIVNSKYLNDILVVFENGKVKDALIEYKSEESLNSFLQDNEIIPEVISDNVDEIMKSINLILDESYSLVYIPYRNTDLIEEQNKILKEISSKYSIEYKKIDAYLLSKHQQEKINQLLGLSTVEDQIIVLIKDNKMIGNIRGIHGKNTYIDALYDLKFIDEIENKINEIDYDTFKKKLKNTGKSIILIGMDNSKDTDSILNILNSISYNYNVDIDYINVNSIDSSIYNYVKEKLQNLGYKDGFSLPLVVIVESNNILDYVIGNTKEEYFIDIFIENGVIKGEILDE